MKEHFLTLLRHNETNTPAFREAAKSLASLVASEAAKDLPLMPSPVQTPLSKAQGSIFDEKVVLVPILRAGLVLLFPFLEIFSKASIGFLGIRRDEKDAHPHLYYENIPQISSKTFVFLLDPILATGGTADLALTRLQKDGALPERTQLITFLAARPGMELIESRHPAVKIRSVAIDDSLNSKKFIVPGLGDFGDRYFGT